MCIDEVLAQAVRAWPMIWLLDLLRYLIGVAAVLAVIDLAAEDVEAITSLLERGMRLTAMVQDGELQLMSDRSNIALTPRVRVAAAATA